MNILRHDPILGVEEPQVVDAVDCLLLSVWTHLCVDVRLHAATRHNGTKTHNTVP